MALQRVELLLAMVVYVYQIVCWFHRVSGVLVALAAPCCTG
jgi:hypothetical protein